MFEIIPIVLAEVKVDKISDNLLNGSRQIVYSLY